MFFSCNSALAKRGFNAEATENAEDAEKRRKSRFAAALGTRTNMAANSELEKGQHSGAAIGGKRLEEVNWKR